MKEKKKPRKSAEATSSTAKEDEDQEISQLTVRKQQESPLPGQQRLRFKFNQILFLYLDKYKILLMTLNILQQRHPSI